jgi:two-component system, sporulation sensor kinase D
MKKWFLDFMDNYSDHMADEWALQVDACYPALFDLVLLKRSGLLYLQFIKDLHIPVEAHPVINTLSEGAKRHIKNGIPITYIFHISQMYRRVFFSTYNKYSAENSSYSIEANSLMSPLADRIDFLQKLACDIYLEHSHSIIKSQEQIIKELHNDRLSLLGKMASSMAHEIKNPLFALEGFLKLIHSEGKGNHKIERYIEIMEGELQHLLQHIKVFLSFSKNQIDEEPAEKVALLEMLHSIHNLMTPQLISKGISLHIDIEESSFKVQRGGLQQVLVNLISNSIDALEMVVDKKIHIEGKVDNDFYLLSIIDNGPGIPAEFQQSLFIPFFTEKTNGTGLGLAISKEIVEKNRGSIQYTSEVGRTVFTLRFPIFS